MEIENHLSRNIRFLRKSRHWSQEELANQLQIKRSNIAAYESKNVEPRLSLILRMAKLFDVNMAELIHTDIALNGGVRQAFQQPEPDNTPPLFSAALSGQISAEALDSFVEQSLSVRKMLEGFKIFYEYKKEASAADQSSGSAVDIDNFLDLIGHMINLNESLIDLLRQNDAEE
ncbi:helix-turn-helix transcriptional regulator [Phaeodactylibacter sp.]|jgi:transcriptional regulator with XRE-family HTH domain|uniref:helix-turn-helix domain-containing protein n=1 Tax=Phaeodactylibacter sp. TaxID=1940289 RepID=UPI0025F4D41D|nr:helix-turn-helix transcriptional regulator [Phaeodactylibacter sp.]MCI4651286.1 helix-turn-helix domain-containing protein [Phaeodactylibacter sp.]MCI5092471.1 helix-turn-helix domain-containing protein [Phaeodactylibacter sp.]